MGNIIKTATAIESLIADTKKDIENLIKNAKMYDELAAEQWKKAREKEQILAKITK